MESKAVSAIREEIFHKKNTPDAAGDKLLPVISCCRR